tara:strand:+ start:12182 stop:12400 length:219 start_codon:yes stop_codon:yes gene_type:complete
MSSKIFKQKNKTLKTFKNSKVNNLMTNKEKYEITDKRGCGEVSEESMPYAIKHTIGKKKKQIPKMNKMFNKK